MARLITARRADTCTAPECAAPSRAIQAGDSINYGGPGAVTHANCPPMDAPGRPRGRRYAPRYGGRCTHEDYPCCGC